MDKLMKRTFNAQVSEQVLKTIHDRKLKECVRILDLRVQVHPGELWVSKQRVHIVLEASKSAGAKSNVQKICRSVHLLHPR